MLFFLAWQVYHIDDPSGLIDELAGANYFFLIAAVYLVLFPGSVNGGVKVGRVGGGLLSIGDQILYRLPSFIGL